MSDLHYQVQHGTANKVAQMLDKYLNEVPADLDRRDIHGNSVLHKAAAVASDPDIIRILLEYGADKKAKNARGDHPIDLARENKKVENIALLLNYNPDWLALQRASQADRELLVTKEREKYLKFESDRMERERAARLEADRIERERDEKAKADRLAEKEAARRALEEANSAY